MTNKPTQILPERRDKRALFIITLIATVVSMSILLHNYSIKRDMLIMSTYTGDWIYEQ